MTSLLVLITAAQVATTTTATGSQTITIASPHHVDAPIYTVQPDVITRGRTSTVIVMGEDLEELKSLTVDPADGVQITEIKPISGSSPMVSVTIQVDASAQPGDRDLQVMSKPHVLTPVTRGGTDEFSRQIDQAIQSIVKENTKPATVTSLHINTKDMTVTNVRVGPIGTSTPVTIVANSENELMTDHLDGAIQCGDELVDVFPKGALMQKREGARVTLSMTFDTSAAANRACELHLQLEDKEGNWSPWIAATLK